MSDCTICMGHGRVMVGMSFPPNSTIAVKAEYDPCPGCTPPPHTFHAKRTAQILAEIRNPARVSPLGDGGGPVLTGRVTSTQSLPSEEK